jgi:hypothetical protein
MLYYLTLIVIIIRDVYILIFYIYKDLDNNSI